MVRQNNLAGNRLSIRPTVTRHPLHFQRATRARFFRRPPWRFSRCPTPSAERESRPETRSRANFAPTVNPEMLVRSVGNKVLGGVQSRVSAEAAMPWHRYALFSALAAAELTQLRDHGFARVSIFDQSRVTAAGLWFIKMETGLSFTESTPVATTAPRPDSQGCTPTSSVSIIVILVH